MSRLVEEVLDAWRHAERLLDDLPPVDPDHETVRLAIDRLRDAYRELTELRDRSEETLLVSADTLARATALLGRVEARLGRPRASAARDGRLVGIGEGSPG